MAKIVGTLGIIDTLTVAGCTFTDLVNIKVLGATNSTTANISTFRQTNVSPLPTSGYAVTSGKTLTIRAIKALGNVTLASGNVGELSYGDSDCGMDGTTAVTNPKYWASSTGGLGPFTGVPSNGGNVTMEAPVFFSVPQSKYINVTTVSWTNAVFMCFGMEA